MQKEITVLVVEPLKPPEVKTIPNKLSAFQKIVDGYVEQLRLRDGTILVCNEEGKILGLPPNRVIPEYRDVIYGTFFITADDVEGCFKSLTEEQILRNKRRFLSHLSFNFH